jgi:GAF domain-containing protein
VTNAERFRRLFLDAVVSQCELSALALYRVTHAGLVLAAASGERAATVPGVLPLGGLPAGVAARKGERRIGHDVVAADAAVPGTRAEVVEPVLFEGLPVGVLLAAADDPQGVGDWTVQLAALLAARLGPVLAWASEDAALAAAEAVDALAEAFPERFDWTGVYARVNDDELQLVAFVGEPTPHVRIPVDTGLCGAAVRENAVLNVPDVRADDRYLACSLRTRAELVVPVRDATGAAVAELDVDSDRAGRFAPDAVAAVEQAAAGLARWFGAAS